MLDGMIRKHLNKLVNVLRLYPLIAALMMMGCKKEIFFDYNEIEPVVVVEGRVTNEGTQVFVSKSRSMNDSVKARCLMGALVTVTADGVERVVAYDEQKGCYASNLIGTPGTTYQLAVDFEGHHYEGTSTMPSVAPVLSAEFLWQPVLEEKLLAYEVWAVDPNPQERNYYWYRMDRTWHHPHFEGENHKEAYRWNAFDDRGCPPGKIYRDVMCMSERAAEEDEEENWKGILYEGDTITFQLMTIDRDTYEYFTSLRAGQGGGANPRTNLTGGCQGYFAAGSVSHADTLVYSKEIIKER